MKISKVDLSSTTSLSAADLYTLANAHLNVTGNPETVAISGSFSVEASGQTVVVFRAADLYGGDSIPVVEVQPQYYPKAVKGAECGALINDLSWADENLEAGYQFVRAGTADYFVAGILNSTQTDANDPFTKGAVIDAGCWKEGYSRTFQVFN